MYVDGSYLLDLDNVKCTLSMHFCMDNSNQYPQRTSSHDVYSYSPQSKYQKSTPISPKSIFNELITYFLVNILYNAKYQALIISKVGNKAVLNMYKHPTIMGFCEETHAFIYVPYNHDDINLRIRSHTTHRSLIFHEGKPTLRKLTFHFRKSNFGILFIKDILNEQITYRQLLK